MRALKNFRGFDLNLARPLRFRRGRVELRVAREPRELMPFRLDLKGSLALITAPLNERKLTHACRVRGL